MGKITQLFNILTNKDQINSNSDLINKDLLVVFFNWVGMGYMSIYGFIALLHEDYWMSIILFGILALLAAILIYYKQTQNYKVSITVLMVITTVLFSYLLVQGGVEGRMRANIVLPNAKIFPAGAFCFIDPVLNKHNTFKIKQYQIIQQKINEIDILLVIDEDLRHKGISVETLKEENKHIYQQKVGLGITITVKEVDEITHPKDASKPPPIVISHVSEEERYQILDR